MDEKKELLENGGVLLEKEDQLSPEELSSVYASEDNGHE